MSVSSDGEDGGPMEIGSDDDPPGKGEKRKYTQDELNSSISREELRDIIGISKKKTPNKNIQTQKTSTKKDVVPAAASSSKRPEQQKTTNDIPTKMTKHKNYSTIMKDIINKQYANLFYINTDETINDRIKMADLWESARPTNKDVILMTKKGFLLKSDTPKVILNNSLKILQKQKKIISFSETAPYTFSQPVSTTHSIIFLCNSIC